VGYLRKLEAFVEAIPRAELLSDAKMRNAFFFQKLGLADTDASVDLPRPEAEATEQEVLETAPAS
jgi:hypothetical protein